MPSFIFYDNNCLLRKHLEAQGDTEILGRTGLPVDVFHFECKHSESDVYCAEHCNPASFPELMEGNRWVFNSSAAEQANVWFGQFQSIVREMTVEKYEGSISASTRQGRVIGKIDDCIGCIE
jgi:hypothetical protein